MDFSTIDSTFHFGISQMLHIYIFNLVITLDFIVIYNFESFGLIFQFSLSCIWGIKIILFELEKRV